MVYKRLALIAALLAILGAACGGAPASESATPPAKAVARQTPTAEPTPVATATQASRAVSTPIPTPASAAPLPLGESTLEAVDFFYEHPEVAARAVLAKGFDTGASDPRLDRWMNQLEGRIAASPMIYQMYTWAHYPIGTYPNIEQFMDSFLRVPQAYGQMASDWLDSDPCTWPEEVQEQVIAIERNSPGRLRASIAQATVAGSAAESVIRAITINARGRAFDDRDAYLDQFRCTGAGGQAVIRTPAAPVSTPVATATQRPVSAPTPVPTTISTPAPAAPLPLGESTLEAVDFFYEHPEVVARAALAKMSDSNTWDPTVSFWVNRFERRITLAPAIYQLYTWAYYPVGRYPNVEQFMGSFLLDPRAYAQAARDWLDSDPCTWPKEVQAQVVAFEREFTGQLSATVASVSSPAYARESQWDLLIQMARQEHYEDSEAYLNRFRCTGASRPAVRRTFVPPTPPPVPTATPTPAPEVLTAPREPRLAREIVVSYLAEKVRQEPTSSNVQYWADQLAYLTESAPWALNMYIEAGYRIPVAEEPGFYGYYLLIPGCVLSHEGLSEGQVAAFATDFSRRWPEINPHAMPGIAALEEMTFAQQRQMCGQFASAIDTAKPN